MGPSISARDARIFTISFLLLISLPLLVDVLMHALHVKAPGRAASKSIPTLSWVGLMEGDTGPAIENSIKNASFWVNGVGSSYNELTYRLIQRRPADIVIGRDKAIYLSNEIGEWGEAELERKVVQAVGKIESVVRQIEAAGVKVNVMLVPSRSRLYQDNLPYAALPANRARFYEEVLRRLLSKDIDVTSLYKGMLAERDNGKPLFYRDDHHWTYHGAQLAADLTAAHVRREWGGAPVTATPYAVDWREGLAHRGSLNHKLNFIKGSSLDQVFADPQPEAIFSVNKHDEDQGNIYLFTTSYGLWGFPQFLSNALGFKLHTLIGNGKSSFYAPAQFISQILNAPRIIKPRGVIWEVQEYHLYRDDLIDGFGIPEYQPAVFRSVDFALEAGRGTSSRSDGVIAVEARQSQIKINLTRPTNRIRLIARSTSVPSRATIGLAGENKENALLIFDGQGAASYDFQVERPKTEFVFRLNYTGEAVFELEQVQIPSNSMVKSSDTKIAIKGKQENG